MRSLSWWTTLPLRGLTRFTLLAALACSPEGIRSERQSELAPYTGTDSMGAIPDSTRVIAVHGRPDLVENSAAVMSDREPDVLFTVNDSGNDPMLFALDTTGTDRGAWLITNATNVDWEAASRGPCQVSTDTSVGHAPARTCLYIGDVGDNAHRRLAVTLYRVPEPMAQHPGFTASLTGERLTVRYPDAPHDVEAMYVAPDGTTMLITKRQLRDGAGHRRPALVFAIDRTAWGGQSTVVATLVDSLPIIPGSDRLREITDASLSADGRLLAVRTYGQVYVFKTDSITGRVQVAATVAVCNVARTEAIHGEGITWFGPDRRLLLTSEGLNAPMHVISCPMPVP